MVFFKLFDIKEYKGGFCFVLIFRLLWIIIVFVNYKILCLDVVVIFSGWVFNVSFRFLFLGFC